MSESSDKVDDAPQRFSLPALLILTLLTAAAAQLRIYQIWESLWLDELHTAWTVAAGISEVAGRAAAGNQGPLYFWLAWASTTVFGLNEFVLRFPSVAAGTALVPAMAWVVFRWTGSRIAALLAAVLVAVDPRCLEFSLEARPYAIVQLVALLHVYVFSRLVAKRADGEPLGRKATSLRRAALVAGAVVLFYLHYTTALLFVAEATAYVALTVWSRGRLRYRWTAASVDAALVALAALPALGHIRQIGLRRDNWSQFIDQRPAVEMLQILPLDINVLPPLALLVLVAAGRWLLARRPLIERCDLPVWTVVASWLALPVALAWTATAFDWARLFFPRYLMASAAAPMALGGLLCASCAGKWARITVAVVVAGAAVYASGVAARFAADNRFVVHSSENWRDAVDYVNRQTAVRPEPVLVYSGLIEAESLSAGNSDLRRYCLLPVTGMYRIEGRGRLLVPLGGDIGNSLSPQTVERLRLAGKAWLIVRGQPEFAGDVAAAVAHELQMRLPDERVVGASPRYFGGVVVVRVEVAGP